MAEGSDYVSTYWDTMFYWSSDVADYEWLSDDVKIEIMTQASFF